MRKIIFLMLFVGSMAFGQNKPQIVYATLTDVDGNMYTSVTIAGKTWMAENLKVVHFNDGTSIPKAISPNYSIVTDAPQCGVYNNVKTMGAYYNWYAVNTGKLCPSGWRIPTQADWQAMATSLGGMPTAGNKLKAGSAIWNTPNSIATNESGFTGLPAGYVWGVLGQGDNGNWWTLTQSTEDANAAYYGRLYAAGLELQIPFLMKYYGISVRCLK